MTYVRPMAVLALLAVVLVGCTTPAAGPSASVAGAMAYSPEVTTIEPTEGSLVGGETVTIVGAELDAVTRVTFGGRHATSVTVQNSTTVTAVVPHSMSYVSGSRVVVEVFDPSGKAAAASDPIYTYYTLTAVDRQLEYAFAHWQHYNLEQYGDFTTWGGDCANFVSQTLVARGWTVTDDWFNEAQQDWAPAFVHVPSFDERLAANPQFGAVKLTYDQRDRAKIGDVVVFDWEGDGSLDHAQVISGIDGDTIYMVGHDINTTYRSIDRALDQQGTPAATVAIWSIPLA